MHQKYKQDTLIKEVLTDLESRFSKHVISVFGIGSYFDENLPLNWIKNDVDLIAIVDSLDIIPKQDWTEVRYEKKRIGDKEIWTGFNTLAGLQNREQFQKESFANYEWSLLDLKLSENSVLLYGRNIRNQLPEVLHIKFDYENVLIRSLYHLNKCFTDRASLESMREFTKGVFKFVFYLCVYLDSQFRFTSVVKIAEKIKLLVSNKKINSAINSYFEEAVIFRITSQFKTEFTSIRDGFFKFVLSLLTGGTLHVKLDKFEVIKFFKESFGGFGHLIRFVKKLESLEAPKIVEDESKNDNYLTPKLQAFGIKDSKMRNVICPHCSSKCSTTLKFCGICGEHLPK